MFEDQVHVGKYRSAASKAPFVITLDSSSNLVRGPYFLPNNHPLKYLHFATKPKEFSQVSPPVSGCLLSRLCDWQVEDLDWTLVDRSIFSGGLKVIDNSTKADGRNY